MTNAGGRSKAKWLVLAMIASGCDDRGEPNDDDPMATESTAADDGDTPFDDGGDGDGDGAGDGDGDGTSPADAGPTPTFAADVLPILQASCSCHGAGAEAGVDLSDEAAYDTLVFGEATIGVPFVVPEQPDASYVVLKLRGEQASVGGGGSRMPLGTPLAQDEIDAIAAWIEGGAPP